MPSKLPRSKRITIPGPAGAIEALVEVPEDLDTSRFGLVCHPHPLHGGTMHNKVTHSIARAMHDIGVPTIRFNFRGVGASAGEFAEGVGELEDALAVLAHARERWPQARPVLGGFSFGGFIAIRAAARVSPECLITVAPAVTRLEQGEPLPDCPWLIVQGDADEVIDPRAVFDWVAALERKPTLEVLPGAGHFFHGRLIELRDLVMGFMRPA